MTADFFLHLNMLRKRQKQCPSWWSSVELQLNYVLKKYTYFTNNFMALTILWLCNILGKHLIIIADIL